MSLLTTPRTWVAGEVVTAAIMNTEVRDALTGLQAAWVTDGRATSAWWTASSTNPAIGNGTTVSRIYQVGKMVTWKIVLTMGSTSTYGSGAWQLVPPVTLRDLAVDITGRAYTAAGTAGFTINCDASSTTLITLRTPPTTAGAIDRSVGAAAPIAWASGAILALQLQMEQA